MKTDALERMAQLADKVKKLRAERDEKVAALDAAVEAAEKDLREAAEAVRGAVNDALGVTKRQPGEAGVRRTGEVEELLNQGLSVEQIAEKTGRKVGMVERSVRAIEAKREKKNGTSPPAPPAARQALPPPTSSNGIHDDDDDEEPSLDDIQDAAIGNMKGSRARLMTSARKQHKHVAEVDRNGNGYTTAGKDGHIHAIKDFVVGPGQDGHRHFITTDGA